LRQGVRVVDFRSVTDVDSAAVALALEWLRSAAESGRGLRLANLPAAMQNLAKLTGLRAARGSPWRARSGPRLRGVPAETPLPLSCSTGAFKSVR